MSQSGKNRLIVFVCTGNICRSPMAEYLMRRRLGDPTVWSVASAGVFAMDGAPASAEAVQALSDLDIDASGHRSQVLTDVLIESATLLAVMTASHKQQVLSYFPDAEGKVFLLTEFGVGGAPQDVSDPIGQSLNVYRYTRDQIDSALSDLILYMKERWGLSEPPS